METSPETLWAGRTQLSRWNEAAGMQGKRLGQNCDLLPIWPHTHLPTILAMAPPTLPLLDTSLQLPMPRFHLLGCRGPGPISMETPPARTVWCLQWWVQWADRLSCPGLVAVPLLVVVGQTGLPCLGSDRSRNTGSRSWMEPLLEAESSHCIAPAPLAGLAACAIAWDAPCTWATWG